MLLVGTFINRFGSFVVPFLVLYSVHRGLSVSQAGLVAGLYGAGSIFASIGGGYFADRLGRRATIALSMIGSSAAMLALSQVRSLALLAGLAVFAGSASELYRPAAGALIGDLVPPIERVTAFAAYRLAVNVGYAAGPATAGFLVTKSFTWLFAGDAATSIAFAFLALMALPPLQRGHAQSSGFSGSWRSVLRAKPFVLLLIAYLCAAFVYFQSQSTLPLQVRALGMPPSLYGTLLSLNGVVVVALELPISAVTQRFPPRSAISAGLALIGAGFALTAAAHSALLLAVTVVIWTVGEMVHSPVSHAYVASLAPPHLRGRYVGAFGLAWSAGLVLAPVLGVSLFARNHVFLWILCGFLGAVAGLLAALSGDPRFPEG